ncbi:MAG: hypothetical protein ACTHJ3_05105 [Pararhizobium sp.]
MSRFPSHKDMTADDIEETSYDLLAILHVGEVAANHLHEQHSPVVAGALSRLLRLAVELHGPVHDALEVRGEASS